MNKDSATQLIRDTFTRPFDEGRYKTFIRNLFNHLDESKAFSYQGQYIPDAFKGGVRQYKRLGTYTDPDGEGVDVIIVYLHNDNALDHARTLQRNFITHYLKHRGQKESAIVAFAGETLDDWRFSLVRLDYRTTVDGSGRVKTIEELTPARRYSFLVGENEPNHTAQQQLYPILEDDHDLTVAQLEAAFNIESITKEFFEKYKGLFLQLKDELDNIAAGDKTIQAEFTRCDIDTAAFAKKLLGQIVFLYFLQKKGWMGCQQEKEWGAGSKNFLFDLFDKKYGDYHNFFNDMLEPLFYTALAVERKDSFYPSLNCKIPFLNGGLFEPVGGYDWQKIHIPIKNETFNSIFETFNQYNFTVREDEPLEREVAVDPEMLGKVFENLLEVKDRKSKGAFYTPREIVHYMCQESLINYLDTTLNQHEQKLVQETPEQGSLFGMPAASQKSLTAEVYTPIVPREDIEVFIRHGEVAVDFDSAKENGTNSYDWKLKESIRTHAKEIDQALADIKICDPAIGSGAFPVGMMSEIIKARDVLSTYLPADTSRSVYNFKRQAIENSIYGVDIDSSAVDIARLRLWLSLVVDENDFLSIKPLPNLDYKIVCGNSLMGFPDNWGSQIEKEIESLIHQHFNETNVAKKIELKLRIDEKIESLYKNSLKTFGYQINFDFRTVFSEVFQNHGGFDVIIANPPYVGQKGNQELFDDMKNDKNFEKKMDYWYFFLHKAHYISNNNGLTTFITPNYWVTANGAKKLRNKIINGYYFIEWINFNDNNVFEAGIHTNVFILKKSEVKNELVQCTIYKNTYNNDLISHKNTEFNFTVDQNYLYQQWTGFVHFLPQESLRIVNKLIQNSLPLCDTSTTGKSKEGITAGKHLTDGICNINQGLVTGKDRHIEDDSSKGVFVVNKTEYEEFIPNDRVRLRPFYKNSDIKRYFASQSPKYFLVSVNDIDSEIELKKYKSIYAHLSKYKSLLMKRSINGVLESAYKKGKWWAMTTDRPNIDFDGEKILCPQRSNINTFAYTNESWYASADVYYITNNKKEYSLKYILAILNSKLIYYWLYHMGKRKGEMLELYLEPLQFVPIKNISYENQVPFITLIDQILKEKHTNQQADTATLERDIDQLIYHLYGLTKEEIAIIENSLK